MRLPDPQRSYAVLVGVSSYTASDLEDLPSVSSNLRDLAALLTPTFSPDRCIVIPEPAQQRETFRLLRRFARQAEDTFLIYFAGHGRLSARNELYLSLADTDVEELEVSALPFDRVRDILAECPAANRVVILDCCFSGRAIRDLGDEEGAILGQIGIEGTYVLTSAPANSVALAPVGAKHTVFTGELITLLRDGLPAGPEFLTVGAIYRHLLHILTSRKMPRPRQQGTGTADFLALARNPAHPSGAIGATADGQGPQLPPPPRRSVDTSRLTTRSREVIVAAVNMAVGHGHGQVEPWHLLVALVDTEGSTSVPLLQTLGADPVELRGMAAENLAGRPVLRNVSEPNLSRGFVSTISAAQQIADELGDDYISTEHLLAGLGWDTGGVGDVLADAGVTAEALIRVFPQYRERFSASPQVNVERYGVDLTLQARSAKLDPLIGRDKELNTVIQVLGRRSRNNPVLVGERGVGKTAIVHGLAQRIDANDVPDWLRYKTLLALNQGPGILAELASASLNAVVYVEDLGALLRHDPVRVSSQLGQLMRDGKLQFVGAMTPADFRNQVESDPNLIRCVQPVLVPEAEVRESISVLRLLRTRYETHHEVDIPDSTLVAAARLAQKHVADGHLPSSAIDLIDEAAARVRMEIESGPAQLGELRRSIARLEAEDMSLRNDRDSASIEELKQVRKDLADSREQLSSLESRWRDSLNGWHEVSRLRGLREQSLREAERTERAGELARAAELRYGVIPQLEADLLAVEGKLDALRENGMLVLEGAVTISDLEQVINSRTANAT